VQSACHSDVNTHSCERRASRRA